MSLSPPLSPVATPTPVFPASISPLKTRNRSRTFTQAEADVKRQREEESARARAGEEVGSGAGRDEDGGGEITAKELRAEMETLLSLRRRSLSQPATVDPDLPPTSPTSPSSSPSSSSPRTNLAISVAPLKPAHGGGPVSPTAPTAAETGTLVRRRSSASNRLPSEHPLPLPITSSPSTSSSSNSISSISSSSVDTVYSSPSSSQELFWLPASLHPELAPQEFKAFIREQTRPDNLARRTSSSGLGGYGGGRVDRKKSTLRGEYKPRTDDGVGERRASDLAVDERRTTSRLKFEELTISDLQRLEELASRAEAEGVTEGEGEGERLGRVLRRSLSLNPNHVAAAAVAGGHMSSFHNDPLNPTDSPIDGDSPLIVPPPGQILRRSARTKIRKAGLTGDGGGHRFGPSRRGRTSTGDLSAGSADDGDYVGDLSFDSINSDETSASETTLNVANADSVVSASPKILPRINSEIAENARRTTPLEPTPVSTPIQLSPISPIKQNAPLPPPPPSLGLDLDASDLPPSSGPAPSSADFDWLTHQQQNQMQQQQQQPQLTQQGFNKSALTTLSPAPPAPISLPERYDSVENIVPQAAIATSARYKEEKGKKSGWARLGLGISDETSKKKKGKGKAEGDKMTDVGMEVKKQSERDRDQREREKEREKEKESGFFGGLFGGKKKIDSEDVEVIADPTPAEVWIPTPSPTASGALTPSGKYTNFYRLPIHVERAIYRLSHIKLANPRRPLYEQVLISNLMFWYLSIINKPATPIPTAAPVPVPGMRNNSSNSGVGGVKEEHQEKPRADPNAPRDWKRAGLNKDGRRSPGRTAEMPIRQPQYEQQNRQIEEEQNHHQNQRDHSHHHQPHHPPHLATQHLHHQYTQNSPPASPSTSPDVQTVPLQTRSPDRTSAPANLNFGSSIDFSNQSNEDEEDNRPLGTHRDSYPPHRPTPVTAYRKTSSGFEVTSRQLSPNLSKSPNLNHDPDRLSTYPNGSSPGSPGSPQNRRTSSGTMKSFDESDLIEAYARTSTSPSPMLSSPSYFEGPQSPELSKGS